MISRQRRPSRGLLLPLGALTYDVTPCLLCGVNLFTNTVRFYPTPGTKRAGRRRLGTATAGLAWIMHYGDHVALSTIASTLNVSRSRVHAAVDAVNIDLATQADFAFPSVLGAPGRRPMKRRLWYCKQMHVQPFPTGAPIMEMS